MQRKDKLAYIFMGILLDYFVLRPVRTIGILSVIIISLLIGVLIGGFIPEISLYLKSIIN